MIAAAALALTGCAGASAQGSDRSSTAGDSSTSNSPAWAHAHGIYASPDGTQVMVATHDGLYDYSSNTPTRVGEPNDYMGFAGDGATFYASGHPGAGSSLPEPLGFARSTDGGKTWTPLSLAGKSDFHALTLTRGGAVGFDGSLRTTADLTSWTDATDQVQAFALAGRPDTAIVLATTPTGVQRSVDSGRTWKPVDGSPVVQFAALAGPRTAAGITPDGNVHISTDAGLTWTAAGKISGQVQAMTATESGGKLRIWVVTASGVQVSTDGGRTFTAYTGKVAAK